MKLRKIPLLLFLFINILFVLKHAERITAFYPVVALCYVIAVFFAIFFSRKLLAQVRTNRQFLFIFCALCLLFIGIFSVLLYQIDPMKVKPDRWKVILTFLDSLLSGEFPYTVKAHRFPGLFIIALPFYLMGDVGLLQIFGFTLFSVLAYRYFAQYENRIISVTLLGTAPIFLWEVAVRSELFSNMVLTLALVLYANSVKGSGSYAEMVLCGAFTGLILSTRVIVILPLILYFTDYFRKQLSAKTLVFLCSSFITFLLTILPFYLWNSRLFIENNPLLFQLSVVAGPSNIAVILASLPLGFFVRGFDRFLLAAGYSLFAMVAFPFFLSVFNDGWHFTVFENGFDISYFQFATPFLLLSAVYESDKRARDVT